MSKQKSPVNLFRWMESPTGEHTCDVKIECLDWQFVSGGKRAMLPLLRVYTKDAIGMFDEMLEVKDHYFTFIIAVIGESKNTFVTVMAREKYHPSAISDYMYEFLVIDLSVKEYTPYA